ncbi:hypothetical protein AERO9AM_10296 [Aeromicrobium sp. 9AM]|nr:hypothetical protein AERO9AM_10296 [Aeromicrobium sp. 9AM]
MWRNDGAGTQVLATPIAKDGAKFRLIASTSIKLNLLEISSDAPNEARPANTSHSEHFGGRCHSRPLR